MGRKLRREVQQALSAFSNEIRRFIRKETDRVIDEMRGRKVRLFISQSEMAKRIAAARRAAGLSGGCSRKTIQRMENRQTPARYGYTSMVRYDDSTCQAWLNDYIASECSRHNLTNAVRYDENRLAHNH